MDATILYNPFIWLALVLELVFKAIALWRCGRNKQLGWYLANFFLNTGGLLPLIYLLAFQKKKDKHYRY